MSRTWIDIGDHRYEVEVVHGLPGLGWPKDGGEPTVIYPRPRTIVRMLDGARMVEVMDWHARRAVLAELEALREEPEPEEPAAEPEEPAAKPRKGPNGETFLQFENLLTTFQELVGTEEAWPQPDGVWLTSLTLIELMDRAGIDRKDLKGVRRRLAKHDLIYFKTNTALPPLP